LRRFLEHYVESFLQIAASQSCHFPRSTSKIGRGGTLSAGRTKQGVKKAASWLKVGMMEVGVVLGLGRLRGTCGVVRNRPGSVRFCTQLSDGLVTASWSLARALDYLSFATINLVIKEVSHYTISRRSS
jgi:hypothetical protein